MTAEEPLGFDLQQITSKANRSTLKPVQPTLCRNGRPHVIADTQVQTEKSGALGTGGNQVPLCFGIGNGQANEASLMTPEAAQTLNAMHDAQAVLACAAVDCRNGTENGRVNGTLQAKSTGGMSVNLQNVCRQGLRVRRLTPLEYERLQGFPDGWTDIGDWTDSSGKRRATSNSARYKALGNSIALPPWKWVLKRICAEYERDATMASLFDGIGGFPLIWEQLNGKGSCRWASEIEDFPMAVTRRRFGEEAQA